MRQPFVKWRSADQRGYSRVILLKASLLAMGMAALLWSVELSAQTTAAQPSQRPNIIVMMADDLGYSDLGCYGGEIQTPHLDRLAKEGLRFSQYYNCALCGPTRAALMTGSHPHQVGISTWTGLLNNRCVTAFELFKQAGYQTCAVGRLDMTTAEDWHEPANIGKYVDRFFGSTGHSGPGNYFKEVVDNHFYRDGKPYHMPAEGAYKTDLITEFLEEFIAQAATQDRPFFIYVSHYAPHWPLHAKPADMDKYRAVYRKLGWDQARADRYRRLVQLGLIDANCPLSSRDSRAPAWETAKHKDWEAARMAAYAGQVDSLDQSVGRIMDALRKTKADQNTLVLFCSDNGASDMAVNQVDRPGKTWRVDGTRTRAGNDPSIPPGGADTFVTAGPAWSNVSNAPFRNHKNSNFEGGIASPLIAWWPGVIQQPGEITPVPAHVTDLLATSLDIAGIAYPAEFHQRKVLPAAGVSLLPVLKGGTLEKPRSLYWATSGCRAIRTGSWKLVAGKGGEWELYNLETDRTELKNLAGQEPARVQQMSAEFDTWQQAK